MPPALPLRVRAFFDCDWTIGRVTQYDNRAHEGAADGNGAYPQTQNVSRSYLVLL